MATGTVTVSSTPGAANPRSITCVCTADSSGNVISDAISVDGILTEVETIPDATDVPTSYNLQVRRRTSTGVDMLNGSGALRSTTDREVCRPEDGNGNAAFSSVRNEPIYLTADTVGNSKKFTAILYFLQS